MKYSHLHQSHYQTHLQPLLLLHNLHHFLPAKYELKCVNRLGMFFKMALALCLNTPQPITRAYQLESDQKNSAQWKLRKLFL